jgi:hypothetical protein
MTSEQRPPVNGRNFFKIVVHKFDCNNLSVFFQKPKANEACPSNVNKKSGNATDGNNGGNGHSRRQDLNTGIAPVALPEEMNDIQVIRLWIIIRQRNRVKLDKKYKEIYKKRLKMFQFH